MFGPGKSDSHLMLPSAFVIEAAFVLAPSVSNCHAIFCVLRSIAVSFPAKLPMYNRSPAIASEANTGLPDGTSKITLPVFASTPCIIPGTDVPKYSLPSSTTGELFTQEPPVENFQICFPVAASTAYAYESRDPKYT